VILISCTPTFVYSLTFPKPIGLVNDYANILTESEENSLNNILLGIEQNTTDEIAIVITNNLQGESIEMYTVELFKEWGIGKQGKDNGILILQVPSEHKYRIEVGYGLEGDLNDAKVGDIARECIETNFSKQKYFDGYKCTIDKIKENLTPVEMETPAKMDGENTDIDSSWTIVMFIIIIIFCSLVWYVLYRTWFAKKEGSSLK
jgi:uncharacterized protein